MLNVVKKYLNSNKYYDQKELFEEAFLSHPNHPSLFAITDSLNHLAIENLAIKIPKEQFVELPASFLTIYKSEFVLLKKHESFISIENDKGRKQKLSSDEFLKDWNQIIVVIEQNSQINNFQLKNSYLKWSLYLLPVALLVLSSVFFHDFSIYSFLILATTLIGLLLSVLILQEKFGIKTELGSKLCNMSSEASCDSVIKSNKSEIWNGLNFYDLPILFFGINFLSLLLNPIDSSLIITGLSFIAIPFLIYSIWLQKFKIKKWCLLCFAVSSIIFLQALFYFLQKTSFKIETYSQIGTYLLCSVLIFSIWFLVKPVLEKDFDFKNELNGLKRFKKNFKVFKVFMKKIEAYEGFENLKGIEFGSSNAATKVTLFLSPSCGHCHKAFKDANELYEKFPKDVYVNILFNVNPDNNQNIYKSIVESLLTLDFYDTKKAQRALKEWHIDNLSLEIWKEKWEQPANDMIVNNQILKQYEWCLANSFNYTPVKIVNGELFPNEYEIDELKYFLNDFSQSIEEVSEVA